MLFMQLIVLQVQSRKSLDVSSRRGNVDSLSTCRINTTGSLPAINRATLRPTSVRLPAISKSQKRRQQRRRTINSMLLNAQQSNLLHLETCSIQELPIQVPLALVRRPINLIATIDGDHLLISEAPPKSTSSPVPLPTTVVGNVNQNVTTPIPNDFNGFDGSDIECIMSLIDLI